MPKMPFWNRLEVEELSFQKIQKPIRARPQDPKTHSRKTPSPTPWTPNKINIQEIYTP